MLQILVSGGSYPDNWKAIQDAHGENFIRFNNAQLLLINWDSGEVVKEINYTSPEESRNPSMMFKVADVTEDSIIPVTNSEIVEYDRHSHQVKNVITHPSFNDLHSVKKIGDRYYVVNTGLEILQVVCEKGEIHEEHNIAKVETWERFSKDVDYRKIGSTKPHETHFNNVFTVGDDIFVTRLVQKDAINLRNPEDKFDIEVGNPHDGVVHEDQVFFTTTDGRLVIFEAHSRKRTQVIDINVLLENSELKPGGWCRGVLPISQERVLVGYTQLRHTKFKEFISWAKNMGDTPAPTRILELDLKNNRVAKEFIYPGKAGSALFSILNLG